MFAHCYWSLQFLYDLLRIVFIFFMGLCCCLCLKFQCLFWLNWLWNEHTTVMDYAMHWESIFIQRITHTNERTNRDRVVSGSWERVQNVCTINSNKKICVKFVIKTLFVNSFSCYCSKFFIFFVSGDFFCSSDLLIF